MVGAKMMGKIITISGPSQIGKDTLLRKLKKFPNFDIITTHTTRNPRYNEINGTSYHFLHQHDFQILIRNNYFVEWDYVINNYYGIAANALMPLDDKVLFVHALSRIALRLATRFDWIVPTFLYPQQELAVSNRIKENFTNQNEAQIRLNLMQEELMHSVMFDYICMVDKEDDILRDFLSMLGLKNSLNF